jgi:hypothetical protein
MRPAGRRVLTLLAVLVAIPALLGATLAIVLVAVLSGIHIDVGSSRHTNPIPVASRTCPYLRAVRTTGNEAATSSLNLIAVSSARPVDYPTGYAAQLAEFDLSLRVAATQSPARLRRKLNEVAVNVEVGRALIRRISDPTTYFERALNALSHGSGALSYADDLVGNQCGFRLSDYAF